MIINDLKLTYGTDRTSILVNNFLNIHVSSHNKFQNSAPLAMAISGYGQTWELL